MDGALEQGDRTPLRGGAVELVAVSKSYPPGAVPVVRDLSLSVATGESVGLDFRPDKLSIFDKVSGRAIRTALHEGAAHG